MENSEEIIKLFGGLTAMARALGHRNPTTVQGWKNSGSIPTWRRHEIVEAAKEIGIKLPEQVAA